MTRTARGALALALTVTLVAGACGGDDEESAPTTTATPGSGDDAGSVGGESVSVTCADEGDDLTDDKGNVMDPSVQGLDLSEATLEVTDGSARVGFVERSGFPAEDGSDPTGASRPLLWALTGSTPDGTPLDVAVQYAEGEGYSSGSMAAVDPALGGADGIVTVEGEGPDAVLSVEVPLAEPLPPGTTVSFHTEYYGDDAAAPRVDDLCPSDFGDLEL